MVHPMVTRSIQKRTDEDKLVAEKEPVQAEMFPTKKALFNRRKQSIGKKGDKGGSSRGCALPFEIIIEILSLLSVKTLLLCKLVCKQWYDLIEDRFFIEKHMKCARFHKEFRDKTEEDQRPFRWVSCLDGLSLERNIISGNFRVRNPAMHLFIDLPSTKNRSINAVICYAESSGFYKVASLNLLNNNLYEAQILTLGQNEHPSWRSFDASVFKARAGRTQLTAFKGVVHYFWTIITIKGAKFYMVKSLDVDTEIITTSMLRESSFSNDAKVFIIRMGVNLALAEIVNDELHFITLIDYKKNKWAEFKMSIPLKFLKKYPEMRKLLEPCGVIGCIVWFQRRSDTVPIDYLYDTKTQIITVLPLPVGKVVSFLGPQTLLSFKGMKTETSHINNLNSGNLLEGEKNNE